MAFSASVIKGNFFWGWAISFLFTLKKSLLDTLTSLPRTPLEADATNRISKMDLFPLNSDGCGGDVC